MYIIYRGSQGDRCSHSIVNYRNCSRGFFQTFRLSAAVAMLTFTLSSFSSEVDMSAAEAATARFHELLDAGSFEQIYQSSSHQLKKASTEDNIVILLSPFHRKLGIRVPPQTVLAHRFQHHWHLYQLACKTIFADGAGSERFVFKRQDDSVVLAGYPIDFNALIFK